VVKVTHLAMQQLQRWRTEVLLRLRWRCGYIWAVDGPGYMRRGPQQIPTDSMQQEYTCNSPRMCACMHVHREQHLSNLDKVRWLPATALEHLSARPEDGGRVAPRELCSRPPPNVHDELLHQLFLKHPSVRERPEDLSAMATSERINARQHVRGYKV
jgi:hypothetical protein